MAINDFQDFCVHRKVKMMDENSQNIVELPVLTVLTLLTNRIATHFTVITDDIDIHVKPLI